MDFSNARHELEQLVLGNISRIDLQRVKRLAFKLRAENDEALLREFVLTTPPSEVLLSCFYEYDLQRVAVDQLEIKREWNLRGRELAGKMLEWCGFPREVKPIGLFQIREEINSSIKNTEEFRSLTPENIDGLNIKIAKAMEKILPHLFYFHIGTLRRETEGREAIEKLCKRYRDGRKSLGYYIGFQGPNDPPNKEGYLTELIRIVQHDNKLKDFCQRYFQSEALLTQNHVAELGMLVIYRNLIAHNWQPNRWEEKEVDARINLLKMDEKTRENWEDNWNNVARSVELQPQQPDLPKREMIQKMFTFFSQFLDLISENQIYPKVIVMIFSIFDNYGTNQISVEFSDPNEETHFLSNCDFTPHTEFYYHPRPNLTDVKPILIPKEELEDWGTKSNINAENQEEK